MFSNLDINILVVDDFRTMRRIQRNNLESLGFKNIFEASNGKKAVEVLISQKIDLIVSDWNMPTMSGLELLRFVRRKEELKDIPFIMVTAEGQDTNIIKAVREKVNGYLIKPFVCDELAEKMLKVLPWESK